ncbi:MAG: NADH-quinone oxidoreductase subunit L [Cyanobacteria bacterium P01_H01_bin.74]
MNWFSDVQNIWVVAIYPLLAFLSIVFIRTFKHKHPVLQKREIASGLTIFATFLGLCHTLFGALPWLMVQDGSAVSAIERNITWLQAGSFKLSMGYLLDSMSVMMLFVVTFISLFIQIYTHGYMNHDKGYAKFFGYLALFNFSMLGLVLSTNLFQIYIFWELVGVSSYLLIGFWFHKPSAAIACMKAFLMNRVGDFGFLFGILGVLLFSFPVWGDYLNRPENQQMTWLSFQALPEVVPYLKTSVESLHPLGLMVIALLVFMGPMAKSAQVPLHTWLPDAMEGPTPISALIHAATMVAAGVYLIARVFPVFEASPEAMIVVASIGTLTALIAASIALTQYDIKKALAYSTMSQLGFMVAAMGFGAFSAGLFHLFTHAFFKAMLFLCSGSVIHACEDEQDMRKMGGLIGKLPVTHITYLIGTLAISGILLSGFWSKDLILAGAKSFSVGFYWLLSIAAGLTSFYMFRTYFLTFWGKYRGTVHVHKEDFWMVMPLAVLAVPSAFIGVAMAGLSDVTIPFIPNFMAYIHYASDAAHGAGHASHAHVHSLLEAIQSPIGLSSLAVGLSAMVLAFVFYVLAPKIPQVFKTAPITASMFNLFSNKWYFDDIYNAFVKKIYLVFASASAEFDKSGVDGIVNGTAKLVLSSGHALKEIQSGKIQTYIAVLTFSVVSLVLLLFYFMV